MRINPFGVVLVILVLAVIAGGLLFWHWIISYAYGHFGLLGVMVGLLLAIMLVMFLRWQESKN